MKQKAPEIDQLAGIEYYSTNFTGVGGEIKKNNNDFNVIELIDKNFISQLTPRQEKNELFAIFKIEKNGIDSNHAVILLKKRLGINFKIMGIKDAKASTLQYASTAINSSSKRIDSKIRIGNIMLSFIGFSKKPLDKTMLIGNRFKINIRNINGNAKTEDLEPFCAQLDSIGNFYGLQRFGSERLVTHLVGKAILKKEFSKAVDILLTYTTKHDSTFSKELREKLRDIKQNPNIVRKIPKGMDIERKIAEEIIKGKDPMYVLRSIPISIRRLFVQAFQAFIFNKTLSKSIEKKFSLINCETDDLCFEVTDNIVFGKIRKFDRINSDAMTEGPSMAKGVSDMTRKKNKGKEERRFIPIIRLPGYAFQPGKSRFDIITKEVMQEEGVTAKDFFIKELQELSESGGYRQAAYVCKDFKYDLASNNTSLRVEFAIPKGAYATTLLREIIKPDDPIAAGF
ncbi:MAG: tRNA pseudouridine(13) synthase TruD [Thermoproteota archaeon]|nr:tRNA pseudouridine(13) synthase TruD [Thermoproteota archaeon]